jgi:hypothetical protein
MIRGDPLNTVEAVAVAFERIGIRYAVGGSLASSLHGIPRATQDADIVATVAVDDASQIAGALRGEFYVDEDMIRDAVRRRSSFNVIHLTTMFKVDVFVAKDDAWSKQELLRARREQVGDPPDHVELLFVSPEDTILHKLVWYRMGGHVSERQWRDAVGVLRVQGDALDECYLDTWAAHFGIQDLLERLRAQAFPQRDHQ